MLKYLRYLILISVSLLFIFPVLYMFTNSFMPGSEVLKTYGIVANGTMSEGREAVSMGFKLIPDRVTLLQYYDVLLSKPKFLLLFWNSVLLTGLIMLGQIIVASLAAYSFSKFRFPLRNFLFFIYILTMMMPFQVTLVPNYIILRHLNLLGSFSAVILPGIFSAFGVFLLRQFMLTIPDQYIEAARMDGASHIKIFSAVIMPQCKGGVASLAILSFIDNWNMVEQPLIFLKNELQYPLSIYLARINSEDLQVAFACGLLYMIPTVLVFLYGENYFVEGIQLSGIK